MVARGMTSDSLSRLPIANVLMTILVCATLSHHAAADELRVSPVSVSLNNPESTQQLLVSSGRRDVTRDVTYESADPKIALVDAAGQVQPVAEGRTTLIVRHDKDEARISVEVTGLKSP